MPFNELLTVVQFNIVVSEWEAILVNTKHMGYRSCKRCGFSIDVGQP